jgi:hypothetical protein
VASLSRLLIPCPFRPKKQATLKLLPCCGIWFTVNFAQLTLQTFDSQSLWPVNKQRSRSCCFPFDSHHFSSVSIRCGGHPRFVMCFLHLQSPATANRAFVRNKKMLIDQRERTERETSRTGQAELLKALLRRRAEAQTKAETAGKSLSSSKTAGESLSETARIRKSNSFVNHRSHLRCPT